MKGYNFLQRAEHRKGRPTLILALSALLLVALLAAACGEPSSTAVPAATDAPAAVTTSVPAAQEPAVVPTPEPEAAHTGRGAGETVLVVEDDSVVRAALADGLAGVAHDLAQRAGLELERWVDASPEELAAHPAGA